LEAIPTLQHSSVQIGPIILQGFEVPTSIRFGGRHRLAVHHLSGGRRIVERLGPDDGEVAFQGTFSGPDAEARARAFDNLRISGAMVWLTWETFRRRVVVKSFVAEYQSPWWIPYKVSCVVAHQTGVSTTQPQSLLAVISSDLGNALSAAVGSTLSLSGLQTALYSSNALTRGSSNQVRAIAAVGGALTTVDNQIALQSAQVVVPVGASGRPDRLSGELGSAVNSAGLLAAAVNIRSYIGRI
jgi:hypothetical protein